MRATTLWLLLVFITVHPVLAQTCAVFVDATYAAAALECADVAPGEACYASSSLTASGLSDDKFSRPGDRVTRLQTLDSGALDLDAGEWGLAVLTVTANAPDQLVTMVVVGEVALENASPESEPVMTVPVRVTFADGASLRARPSAESERVALLLVGQVVPATGQLADGSWLRLRLDDGRSGWVRADLVTGERDAAHLPVVTADDESPESLFSPFQAFNFTSGMDDALCPDAPDSGILLQISQPVVMQINGAEVGFDGTLFLQAAGEMTVHVLENTAQVTSGSVTEVASAGSRIRVRFDPTEPGLTTPRAAEPYWYARLRSLPFRLLPRQVDELPFNLYGIATPAVPDQSLLAGITSTDACTVGAVNEVRLRVGPGRDYVIRAALFAGESANPDGRAQGLDGVLWWRLSEGVWVRSDVVVAAGTCGELPVIGVPPLVGEIDD